MRQSAGSRLPPRLATHGDTMDRRNLLRAAGAAGAAAFLRRLPKRKLPEYSGPPGQESGGPGHGGGPPKLKEYRAPGSPPPNPPPWWMPDGFGGFFGYD
jgi:hypothetical protein